MVTIAPRDEEKDGKRDSEFSEGKRDEKDGEDGGTEPPPQEIYMGEAGGGSSLGRDVG